MSVFSFESPSTPARPFTAFSSGASRLYAAWRRYQSQRILQSLSYDTLKDIGFRSAEDGKADQ